jgi:hypothetical protein
MHYQAAKDCDGAMLTEGYVFDQQTTGLVTPSY